MDVKIKKILNMAVVVVVVIWPLTLFSRLYLLRQLPLAASE
jgi:hypothetical protein